jgi:Mn-dependent DtxR family transcriptional regulator
VGLDWDDVHEEAEALQQAVSDKLVDLGFDARIS